MRLKNRLHAHLQVKISATAKDAFPFLYRVGILKPSSLQHYTQTHLTNAERTRVQPVVFTFHVPCTRFLSTSRREKRQLSQQVCRVFRGFVSSFEKLFKFLSCMKKLHIFDIWCIIIKVSCVSWIFVYIRCIIELLQLSFLLPYAVWYK